jgi:hypothetical protein
MNLKRLLNIAQEADKNGDYVTADKVTNLLKTAQGQYSVYPNQAAYERTPQQSQQMLQAQNSQEEKNLYNQLFLRIQNTHKLSAPYREREVQDIQAQVNSNSTKYPSLKNLQPYLSMDKMNAKNTNYQIQNYEQQKRLEQIEKVKSIMGVPSSYQQSPVSTYYAPVAPGATYYTPGVVNVAQPQMTPNQQAFADLNGLRGQVQQADQVVRQQSMQPRQYPIYQNAPAERQYAQVVTPGMNTEEQYNFNPNAPTNLNLYGTGYASKAMQPQQPQPPQTPQQQQAQPQQQYPYNQRRNPNN